MSELTKEDLKEVVQAAMKEEVKEFYVDREKHYQHHEFLEKMIMFFDNTQGFVWKTFVVSFVVFILGLIGVGFVIWTKTQILGK